MPYSDTGEAKQFKNYILILIKKNFPPLLDQYGLMYRNKNQCCQKDYLT